MQDGPYRFEKLSQNHYGLLQALYRNAFGIQISLDAISKRFDTSTLGSELIGYIAIDIVTNIAVAYYGVFPVKLIKDGKIVQAAQSGDTMTHSDHRKKGLFVKLAKLTFDECKKKNIEIIFGLPNNNSYPGFINKLSWKEIGKVIRYDCKLPFKTFPLPKLLIRLGWFNGYLKYMDLITRRNKLSVQSFINQLNGTKVYRDLNYLNYKAGPEKLFLRIGRSVLWIKFTDVLWVGDFDDYDKIDKHVISELKKLSFLLGYNTISFFISESVDTPFLKHFKKNGEEPLCVYTYDKPVNEEIILTGADFDTW